MNHDQFCSTRVGTFVETRNPSALNQCVDLALQYAIDVWGVSIADIPTGHAVAWSGGKHIPTKFGSWVNNTPTGVPRQGAIIVFNLAMPYGHIAVVDAADAKQVTVIEQNGGNRAAQGESLNSTDRAKNCVRRHTYGYGNVLGWYDQTLVLPVNIPYPVYFQGRQLRSIATREIMFDRPFSQMHMTRFNDLENGHVRGGDRVKLQTILCDPRWSGHTRDPIRLYRDVKTQRYIIENGYHRIYLAMKYRIGSILAMVAK